MADHHGKTTESGGFMAEPYNQKLCDERHKKLDESIDKLQGVLSKFTMLFIAAIISSAFAVLLSCIEAFGK